MILLMIRVCVDSWGLLAEMSKMPVSKLGRGSMTAVQWVEVEDVSHCNCPSRESMVTNGL